MKKLTINSFLFILFTLNLNGQPSILNVEYDVFFNTDLPNTQSSRLIIDVKENKSLYLKENQKNEKDKSITDNNVNLIFKSSRQGFNFLDFESDTLLSGENIFGESYLISENIPEINWSLSTEEKLIDNFKVKKATGSFRGRNYTVWYSLDYPFRFGPWKLNGLPGLIFEAFDDTNRYHWLIKNISLDNEYEVDIPDIDGLITISIFEYPSVKYKSNSLNEKLLSRLPRGSRIENQEVSRNGFEVKFEWEN